MLVYDFQICNNSRHHTHIKTNRSKIKASLLEALGPNYY